MGEGRRRRALLAPSLLLLLAQSAVAQPAGPPLGWPRPAARSDVRPWTRWWWMGSAVTAANIDAELTRLAAAGFGGVEVTAIYGARGAESASVPYLSAAWVDLLAHTVRKARELGMAVDLPLGAGWRLGGPFVPAGDVNVSLRIAKDTARGGAFTALLRPSGDRVKRPAPGGEGAAIDVFARGATDRYLAVIGDRLKPLPRGAVRSFFHDSFEYTGDASAELFAVFRRRRGYDIGAELAALAGEGPADHVARVKSDYRQTLDEMLLENFVQPLAAWSHARGALMREQAHGSPANLLDLYAAVDIPETESFGPLGGADADPLVEKFASSAAHVVGRRRTSAEAFTWLGEHFTTPLAEIKRAADQLFLAGVDHLVYHGTAYSPPDAAWPGWQFYASSEFNSRNAWWPDLPALNSYVTRVQSVLQEGRADNDVLLYWPVWDSWHEASGLRMDFRVHDPTWFTRMPVGEAARALTKAGYGFDYVSDRQLERNVSASRRGLSAGGGTYAAIVVPRARHMPPETFDRLMSLARAGATVLFLGGLPTDVPGAGQLAERRGRLAAAVQALGLAASDASSVRRVAVGRGHVLSADRLTALVAAAQLSGERLVERRGLGFVRRWRQGGYDYFIAADGTASFSEWVPIAARAVTVAIMDPMTGRTGIADTRVTQDGTKEVRLALAPGASRIVRTFDAAVTAARWVYDIPDGPPTALSGRWSIRFLEGGPVLPASYGTDSLAAWTGRGDADADRFAGTARYSLRFDAPSASPDFLLDLGRVAESARVRVNGREVGVLIAPPFQLRTGPLRMHDNLLEVDVTNLSANRIRDLDRRRVAWKIFTDINYVGMDYKPFDASGWPVRVSGLVGPASLTPLRIGLRGS